MNAVHTKTEELYGERCPYENREGQVSVVHTKTEMMVNAVHIRVVRKMAIVQWAVRDQSFRPSYGNSDERPAKLNLRKPGEASTSGEYVETRFDNRRDGVSFRKPFQTR